MRFQPGQRVQVFTTGSPCEVVSYQGEGKYLVVFNKGSEMHREVERVIDERNLMDTSEDLMTHIDFLLFGDSRET